MFGAEAKSLVLLQKSDTTMALLRAVACHESRGCRMVGHVTATVLCLKPPLQSASTMPSKGRPCEARIPHTEYRILCQGSTRETS